MRWLLILAGIPCGMFAPWKYQVPVLALFLLGYAGCHGLKWKGYQLTLAYLYGGISTGLGLQLLIGFGIANNIAAMIVSPLLVWLVLRIFFYAAEKRYALYPVLSYEAHSQSQPASSDAPKGHSAWSGDTMGQAAVPDSSGRHMQYEFHCTGEIAMGGPTYGDVIFSNRCVLSGVGPSIALSEDGRYAAAAQPSRSDWNLLVIDLDEKCVYRPEVDYCPWEIDRFQDGVIVGRISPLTSNAAIKVELQELLKRAKRSPMVEDDGWWFEDFPGCRPLPTYETIAVASPSGEHKLVFVPDLKPFKRNPFLRYESPQYAILVDDVLLDCETTTPKAVWINGVPDDTVVDGRFLFVNGNILDFKDATTGRFSVKSAARLALRECDEHTRVHFGDMRDIGDGRIAVAGTVMPRSVSFTEAEFTSQGWTFPWDEEETSYRDASGAKRTQHRSRIARHLEYEIDLPKYSYVGEIRNCATIRLINRAHPVHRAELEYVRGSNVKGLYSAYTCKNTCGIDPGPVIHEAIWSHCGRYLAVVHYESPPQVPHRISVIDFDTSSLISLPGSHALPSFLWFDAGMLEFSHLVGREESLTFMPGQSEEKQLRLGDPAHGETPYELLVENIDERRAALTRQAERSTQPGTYASGSVQVIVQHGALMGEGWKQFVLQTPA